MKHHNLNPSKNGTKTKMTFVSGMFRSGTTLLGRMLNAHPDIVVASDPYLPLLKALRTQKASELGLKIDIEAPLSNYYFSPDQLTLFQAIQQSSLDLPFNIVEIDTLRGQIQSYGGQYSPKIMAHLDKLNGETFSELLYSAIKLLEECYGKQGNKFVGFKEVWADEFIPCIARSFPDAKFVQIVRDPRAVCASKKTRPSGRYPWLFLIRQWRKLASLAWKYQQTNWLKNRVFLVYYEDLVNNPEAVSREMCDFLGVRFAEDMINPRTYVNGYGKPWRQNTTLGKGGQEFDTDAIDRWRQVLTHDEVTFIETLCQQEMILHGYKVDRLHSDIGNSLLFSPPSVKDDELAKWIKKFVATDSISNAVEMSKERLRYDLLKLSEEELSNVDSAIIEGCYLFRELFDKVRRSGNL